MFVRVAGRGSRVPGLAGAAALMACLALTACSSDIWNAGDLAQWVRDEAVAREDCVRESIELEDWYRSENGRNAWHGRCLDADGAERTFAIGVDEVWTPSSDQG